MSRDITVSKSNLENSFLKFGDKKKQTNKKNTTDIGQLPKNKIPTDCQLHINEKSFHISKLRFI